MDHHAPQERDVMHAAGVAKIGALIVAATVASSAIAYGIMRWHLVGTALGEPHTEVTEREIAGVEQVDALDGWAVRLQVEQRKRLDSYGWTDATHIEVHVPIEKAMHDEVKR